MESVAETERLITQLAVGSSEMRLQAAADLGERKDPRAILPLIQALPKTRGGKERAVIHTALWKFDSSLVVPPLIEAYREANTGGIIPYVEADHNYLNVIAEKGEEAIPTLLNLLSASEGKPRRDAVIVTLHRLSRYLHANGEYPGSLSKAIQNYYGSRAVEIMTAWLTDSDKYLRGLGVCVLAAIATPETVPPLIRYLHQSPEGCQELPDLLDSRKSHFVPALIECLDADDSIRVVTIDCLTAIRDPRSVEPLLKLLPNANLPVRARIAYGIHAFKDDRAVPILLDFLKKASEETSEFPFAKWAASSLARIGTPPALKGLREIAGNPSASIEARAFASMGLESNGEHWQPIERGEGTADVARFH